MQRRLRRELDIRIGGSRERLKRTIKWCSKSCTDSIGKFLQKPIFLNWGSWPVKSHPWRTIIDDEENERMKSRTCRMSSWNYDSSTDRNAYRKIVPSVFLMIDCLQEMTCWLSDAQHYVKKVVKREHGCTEWLHLSFHSNLPRISKHS